MSQIRRGVHFFGDLPIFSDVRPLFAALFPLLYPITGCSQAMRIIRDAPARSLKKPQTDTPFPRGATTRKTPTTASRLPVIELVMLPQRVMRSLTRALITRLG